MVGDVCLWILWGERGMELKWLCDPCPEEMCRQGQEQLHPLGVARRGTAKSDLHPEYADASADNELEIDKGP